MSEVLIAGCGYVGSVAAELFGAAGWKVAGWTRSGAAPGVSCEMHALDLSDATSVRNAPGHFDVIIHCASTRGGDSELYRRVYLEGARNLRQRFEDAAFIFVGSTSVYAQTGGEWVTEESAAEPRHETGKILREAEEFVLQNDGTVTRFAGLYGPGRSIYLQRLLRGEAAIDPENDRFINQLHRDDAARALFLLATVSKRSPSEIYNVADDRPVRQSEYYRWLAAKLDRPVPPAGVAQMTRKRGNSNKRVANTKLRSVGWNPAYPSFHEGMEKSVFPALDQFRMVKG
jgi:nucleoside-diphosphate-sugar epimerase